MNTNEDYAGAAEMVRGITGDDDLAQEIESTIRKREIVKQLMALRAAKGMTQGDVAEKMNCTQSRVSKLERGSDDDLSLAELKAYLRAVEHDTMLVFFSRKLTLVSQVRFHIDMIQRCAARLTELAENDAFIKEGVSKAHVELVVQTLAVVLQSARKLPAFSQALPAVMEIGGLSDFEENATAMAAIPS